MHLLVLKPRLGLVKQQMSVARKQVYAMLASPGGLTPRQRNGAGRDNTTVIFTSNGPGSSGPGTVGPDAGEASTSLRGKVGMRVAW